MANTKHKDSVVLAFQQRTKTSKVVGIPWSMIRMYGPLGPDLSEEEELDETYTHALEKDD